MALTRHAERKIVPFAPRQIFDLVGDVPRYPEFLPWCTAARVRKQEGPNVEIDELAIGFGPLHETFVSRVIRTPEAPDGPRIETVLTTGNATYDEGLLLFLERSGFPEETYHTFSYSPLLDDNGDGLGTPADWFRGVRATRQAKEGASLDGQRAHQLALVRSPAERLLSPETRAKRDALEQSVTQLRDRKPKLAEDEYYRQLEALLLELAHLYESGAVVQ